MTKEIAISQFKSHCLEIIKKLQISGESFVITKRHKPVAKIESIKQSSKTSILGIFKDKAEIKDDLIKPIDDKWSCE